MESGLLKDQMAVNRTCEALIRTVARAFYTDNVVVVLEALIREKYIREEEMGPRLRLHDKTVRVVVNKLEEEMLVSHESIFMSDMVQSKCYYIDYQRFVDLVRYRVYLMDKMVNSSQNDEINETKYKCPTCAKEVGSLEAQKCKSKDYKFICTSCCPHDNFRELPAEAYFRLIPIDPGNKLRNAQSIKTKLSKVLQRSDEHEGIFELLRDLKDVTIKRNTPSDNMTQGFKNSEVTDEDKKLAMVENLGKQVLGKKNRFVLSEAVARKDEAGFAIEITENDGTVVVDDLRKSGGAAAASADPASKKMRTESRVPEFLARSGVHGAAAIYQLESLQAGAEGNTQQQNQHHKQQQQQQQEQQQQQQQQQQQVTEDDIAWEDADDD